MKWAEELDRFDVLSRGKVNPGLFGGNPRHVAQFTELLDEWLNSGIDDKGRESPQNRHLAEEYLPKTKRIVSKSGKAVMEFLRTHPVKITVGTRMGLQGDFGIVRNKDWVNYVFTLFADSDLATHVHRCRYQACQKLFFKRPKKTPYKGGIHCSQRCKSSHSVEEGKRRERAIKLGLCQTAYLWAWSQKERNKIEYREITEVAKDAVVKKGVSKKFYSDHLEEIERGQ